VRIANQKRICAWAIIPGAGADEMQDRHADDEEERPRDHEVVERMQDLEQRLALGPAEGEETSPACGRAL